MVDEGKLSEVSSEFARTLATDFPIQQILDHLGERIVGILPVTSAGVTLIGEERFPAFTTAALAAGLGAVLTFPLHHGGGRLGALHLYRETPGGSIGTRWKPPRRSLLSRRPT